MTRLNHCLTHGPRAAEIRDCPLCDDRTDYHQYTFMAYRPGHDSDPLTRAVVAASPASAHEIAIADLPPDYTISALLHTTNPNGAPMNANRAPCRRCGNDTGLWYRINTTNDGTRLVRGCDRDTPGARCHPCTKARRDELDQRDRDRLNADLAR